MQSARAVTITSNYRVISLSIFFCNDKLVWSISLKVLKIKKMKLDTMIEDYKGNFRMQEPYSVTRVYGVTSLLNFCNTKLVRSISLKVEKGIK